MTATLQKMTTSKGHSVETSLTNREAMEVCLKLTGFAFDLATRYRNTGRLSHDQLVWLHIKAMQHLNPPVREVLALGDFSVISKLFLKAKNHNPRAKDVDRKARAPRLTFTLPQGTLSINLAGDRSRYPGELHVSNGGSAWAGLNEYFGRIDVNGNLVKPKTGTPEWVISILKEFAADPAATAQKYGKLSGRCCMCGRKLEDEKGDNGTNRGSSVEQGYGLTCARKWSLYHTNLKPEEKQALRERAASA